MSLITLSSVTGAAVTGLTTPGYTMTVDTSPDLNSKAWTVSALTGTQTGVLVHKNEMPYRLIIRKVKTPKIPGARSTTTGQYVKAGGKNNFEVLVVKGANVLDGLSGYQYENILCRATFAIPAAVGNDVEQCAAAYSLFAGVLWANGPAIYDMFLTNTF